MAVVSAARFSCPFRTATHWATAPVGVGACCARFAKYQHSTEWTLELVYLEFEKLHSHLHDIFQQLNATARFYRQCYLFGDHFQSLAHKTVCGPKRAIIYHVENRTVGSSSSARRRRASATLTPTGLVGGLACMSATNATTPPACPKEALLCKHKSSSKF